MFEKKIPLSGYAKKMTIREAPVSIWTAVEGSYSVVCCMALHICWSELGFSFSYDELNMFNLCINHLNVNDI